MNTHWPILLALLMVGAGGVYGYYVQSENEEHGKVAFEIKHLPQKYVSTPSAMKTVSSTVQARNDVPATAPEVAQPVFVAPVTPTPQTLQPVNGQTARVAAMAAAGGDRDTVFNALRVGLTQRFAIPPIQTAAGYAFTVQGGRIEVDTAAWAISIYNDNKIQPTAQSEGFLAMLNLVAATLDIDLNLPANTAADGKVTRRPISKLGRLSMITDPALNNSIVIKPIVKGPKTPIPPAAAIVNQINQILPGAPKPPVKPVKPVQAPVQPIRPPTTDQF